MCASPAHVCFAALCYAAGQLREELSNARGINDLTADETTKLLLENSHMQQVRTQTCAHS
jgi:hypothetical protein